MGLLDNTTQQSYYQGNNHGSYQFTSLDDVITQFQIAYVGESKLISKIKRADISFFAQRALQELSFDTFKSCKSQEILLPPSLQMVLPHDYINYTKISWTDNSGIKHPIYPTSKTSNPFKIRQKEDNSYDFIIPSTNLVNNGDFSSSIPNPSAVGEDWFKNGPYTGSATGVTSTDKVHVVNEQLVFEHGATAPDFNTPAGATSRAYACWQKLNVTDIDTIDLSAVGKSAASATGKGVGTIRVGISSLTYPNFDPNKSNPNFPTAQNPSLNNTDEVFDLYTINGTRALLTFNDGLATASTLSLSNIDVSNETEVYVLVTSFIESFTDTSLSNSQNIVDDVSVVCDAISSTLVEGGESTTWSNYKSNKPSENNTTDYRDYQNDVYWPNFGERYGLDPQHSQVNGSFYIDCNRGKIHFSSNLSGKTIVLDYISDSLGTDKEMQVHKLAEEAMYKCIAYAILSTRSNTPEYIVQRFKKEKFAETRKAKLRLSNIKLEEITQILRGKSKQIKH